MTVDHVRRIAATPRLLVALDFDGTVSPHTTVPMESRMLPAARAAIDELVALPETVVAFVSGRSLGDLRVIAEHEDDSPILLEASHGAEAWVPGVGRVSGEEASDVIALHAALQEAAAALVADLPGAWIEPKTFGFGVHTRASSDADEREAFARVDRLMSERAAGWRRRTGLRNIEFSSRHEGKDAGVASLQARTGATAVLFAGDDVTDEDALRTLGPDDLGVHVGERETAAAISVPDVAAFAALLGDLARARALHLAGAPQE